VDAGVDAPATDGGTGDGPVFAAPPGLRGPLSIGTMLPRRPRLRWVLPSGADGAHVQICHDHACTSEVVAFDASGSGGTPPSDLPAGTSFWHAQFTTAGVASGSWTPTWELDVAAQSTTASSAVGSTFDVNGDGYGDVVVGAVGATNSGGVNAAGRAYVYLGGASGLATTPTPSLQEPTGSVGGYFGASVASADFNGDGFSDLIVGASGQNSAQLVAARAYQFLGGSSGLSSTALALGGLPTASNTALGLNRSLDIAAAGDVNGDGFADAIVGLPEQAKALLYLGSASGLATSPSTTLTGPDGTSSNFGFALSRGDVNGDGFSDLVIGSSGSGKVYVYFGHAGGPSANPDLTLTSPDGVPHFGYSVAGTGDVDGDGYGDLVVVAYAPSSTSVTVGLYLFRGSPTGPSNSSALTIPAPDANGTFGTTIASNGDLNGDGYNDIVVNYSVANDNRQRVNVYYGSPTGPQISALQTLEDVDSEFGWSMAEAGDIDGDGFGDLLVGSLIGGNGGLGAVYVYPGNAAGPPASPTLTLEIPSTDHLNFGDFGYSVD
jgi:hypothetical protein